jgi:hypothetical protein
MKKLLLTIALFLATGTAHAATCEENAKDRLDLAACGMAEVYDWAQRGNFNGGEKITKVFKNLNGDIVGLLGERGNLLVSNSQPRVGAPKAFLRQATPPGQLAACDSAEVLMTLARITDRTIDWIVHPKTLGNSENKNFCSVYLSAWIPKFQQECRSNYTVEWIDRSKGTFWVQIVGRGDCR